MTQETNFDAARQFVNFGLREKAAGRRESASGPGSALNASQETIELLTDAIAQYSVRSILDLGCGDWNWMRRLGLPNVAGQSVSYLGWDAHPQLIEYLNVNFRSDLVQFDCKDVVLEPYPIVDMIIARDILYHMPLALSCEVIRKIKYSSKYLLSTSFMDSINTEPNPYIPINNCGYYEINLNAQPFMLYNKLVAKKTESKCISRSGHQRYICLYVMN